MKKIIAYLSRYVIRDEVIKLFIHKMIATHVCVKCYQLLSIVEYFSTEARHISIVAFYDRLHIMTDFMPNYEFCFVFS